MISFEQAMRNRQRIEEIDRQIAENSAELPNPGLEPTMFLERARLYRAHQGTIFSLEKEKARLMAEIDAREYMMNDFKSQYNDNSKFPGRNSSLSDIRELINLRTKHNIFFGLTAKYTPGDSVLEEAIHNYVKKNPEIKIAIGEFSDTVRNPADIGKLASDTYQNLIRFQRTTR